MIRFRNLLILLVMVSFASCLDKIDFFRPKSDLKELVIQGVLIKGKPNLIAVEISNIFDQGGVVSPTYVTVSEVKLINDKGQSKDLAEIDLGKYELKIFNTDTTFSIDYIRKYKIFVKTFAGEEYESSFEKLLPVPKMKTASVKKLTKHTSNGRTEVKEDVHFVEFNISTDLRTTAQSRKANLRWTFLETYRFTDLNDPPRVCYITERPDIVDLKLINGETLTNEQLNNFVVFEEKVDFKFSEGYYLTIIQQSISQSAFEYWAQIKELTGKTGSMFESPAGIIKTNFKTINDTARPVAGFFYATETDTLRLYISPAFTDNERRFCPPRKPVTHPLCTNCLNHPRSTLKKPAFWIE